MMFFYYYSQDALDEYMQQNGTGKPTAFECKYPSVTISFSDITSFECDSPKADLDTQLIQLKHCDRE